MNNKFKFQGKTIKLVLGCMFWYKWGKEEFDIRDVREIYKCKRELQRDFKAFSCTVFQQNMKQLMCIVGADNFKDILAKINGKGSEPF